jgi:hypothetical protein
MVFIYMGATLLYHIVNKGSLRMKVREQGPPLDRAGATRQSSGVRVRSRREDGDDGGTLGGPIKKLPCTITP